jgi:chromatin segregation and condensation protein Rec8/ScpA/Scc1 (kleisin family)
LLQEVVSHPEFSDRSQEVEDLEEVLVAGFDDEEDLALLRKEKLELKFWQKPPFSSLLDPEIAKESEIAFYDLSKLVDEFFDKMLHEDLINYKISGIALKTSATLHHYKISSIIKEEEQIQKREELERFRKRHSRSIPKALPQPIQPKMQIATKDELFDAMRSAIIEVMQKKEKLRRQRIRRDELKQQRILMKSKAQLPKELLKHISGKDQTIEELHESWYNRIKANTNLNNKESTFYDLGNVIKEEEESSIGRKFSFVRMFLALMFLSTANKLELYQDEDFKDISINIK